MKTFIKLIQSREIISIEKKCLKVLKKKRNLTTSPRRDGSLTDCKTDTRDRIDLQAWVYLLTVSF